MILAPTLLALAAHPLQMPETPLPFLPKQVNGNRWKTCLESGRNFGLGLQASSLSNVTGPRGGCFWKNFNFMFR